MSPVLGILGVLVGLAFAVVLLIYVVVPLLRGAGNLVVHVVRCLALIITDALRMVGSVIVSLVYVPLILGNVVIGRWSGAAHFGRALQAEGLSALGCLYRVVVGHPARLLGLSGLTEGLEKRLPAAVAEAPGADAPSARVGQFEGYKIVGSLPGGGSGGKLYIAEPDEKKRAGFARAGVAGVEKVVIKSFSVREGSSLPQIVRESRALEAARKLGLVLDHELTPERFHYVTRYVPGESLTQVGARLHAASDPALNGLDDARLRTALGFVEDLVRTLDGYHRGGLWHKDVKPDNIIVSSDGSAARAHLVDFGLVTPLRSAMTLTTHGTEYFRDPEMVRRALRGVKVHEVDGAKFDIYAAGAVLYALLENSFPAHGVLSPISKRCPESVRWVVRRAMTDYEKRYGSASAMLADVRALLTAPTPFAVRPADLPSVRAGDGWSAGTDEPEGREEFGACGAGAGMGAAVGVGAAAAGAAAGAGAAGAAAGAGAAGSPGDEWKDWAARGVQMAKDAVAAAMVGAGVQTPAGLGVGPAAQAGAAGLGVAGQARRSPMGAGMAAGAAGGAGAGAARAHAAGPRRPASEQLQRARERAARAQERVAQRLNRGKRTPSSAFAPRPNAGVAVAVFAFLGACVFLVGGVFRLAANGPAERAEVVAVLPVEPLALPGAPAAPDAPAIASGSGPSLRLDLGEFRELATLGEFASLPRVMGMASSVPESVEVRTGSKGGPRFVIRSGGRETPALLAPPSQPMPATHGAGESGTVLVMHSVGAIAPGSADEAALAASADRLRRAGFRVVGKVPGQASGEREVAMAAGAEAALGTTPVDSSEAGARLARFLATEEDVDLVLWVTPGRGGAETSFRLFPPALRDPADTDARFGIMTRLRLAFNAVTGALERR